MFCDIGGKAVGQVGGGHRLPRVGAVEVARPGKRGRVERAIVVDPRQVAEDVVTMNSKALLQVDDEEVEVALVYPEDADERAGKLSVCSGIGTAILGYKEGDAFDWRTPERTCHIRIEKVLYQPEAAGDFHL